MPPAADDMENFKKIWSNPMTPTMLCVALEFSLDQIQDFNEHMAAVYEMEDPYPVADADKYVDLAKDKPVGLLIACFQHVMAFNAEYKDVHDYEEVYLQACAHLASALAVMPPIDSDILTDAHDGTHARRQ